MRCEKCGENVHPNGYRVHLRACQGTENKGRARRKIVQCERCNGWFSRILRHAPNCAGPGARGRGRSNRGEIQTPNPGVREDETNSTRRRLRGKQRNPEEMTRRKPGPRSSTSGKQAKNSRGVDEEKPGPRGSKSGKQAENLRGVDDEQPGSQDSTSGKQAESSRRYDDGRQGL